jgi:hypothetical protein
MAMPHLQYTLEETRTRAIRKFNVQGTEYRLKVDPLEVDLPQHLMVGVVHNLFDRKYDFLIVRNRIGKLNG